MRGSYLLMLAVLLGASMAAGTTRADELLPPMTPSSKGVDFNPKGCGPDLPGTVTAVHLLLQTQMRNVGPYRVELDGYGTPELPDTTRPMLLQAEPGTTLRFDLDNQLTVAPPGDAAGRRLATTNLHTHGLIVRPTPYTSARPCPGDNVFQETVPGTPDAEHRYRIDVPNDLPNAFFAVGKLGGTVPHPSGLFWFHAHLHGVARPQVTSGFSGLISIGDPKTHLRVDRTLGNSSVVDEVATEALRTQTDVQTIGLRDIQLLVPCGSGGGCGLDTLPGHAGATPGLIGISVRAGYDPALCATARTDPNIGTDLSPLNSGWCAAPVNDGGSQMNGVWLFTLNGQLFPTATIAPARNQLWRFANLSASLSYVLELVDESDTSKTLPFCVIAMDGVVSGTKGATCPGQAPASPGPFAHVGFPSQQLLLMPAARTEVFLPYDELAGSVDRVLILRTVGPNMGNAEASTQGDVWPPIELLRVVVQARPTPTATALVAMRANLVRTAGPRLGPDAMLGGGMVAPAVPFDLASMRRAYPNCRFMPFGANYRRQVIFDEDEGTPPRGSFGKRPTYGTPAELGFALGSRVVTRTGNVLQGSAIDPAPYPGMGPHVTMPAEMSMDQPPSVAHVCPVLGREEVWELQNWTSEAHNFHIHQGKFRLAQAGDPGLPPGYKDTDAVGGGGDGPGQILTWYKALGGDPSVQAWHDTLPVPPRVMGLDGKITPGHVFVTIPFRALEQVGDFVFHCHILEHEDKGMMAYVQVVMPKGGTRQSTQITQ